MQSKYDRDSDKDLRCKNVKLNKKRHLKNFSKHVLINLSVRNFKLH